ncbi:MAG TPA: c-type cytochrome [Hyphomicrobiaceae bacterium]|nr:c-type cytochrome [Hyphomicrobiaceae bacterium]
MLRRAAALAMAAVWVAGTAFHAAAQTAAPQSLQERIQLCGACHGEEGNSKMERTPSLAGQPELFLANQLILFRERLRRAEAMDAVVRGMSDAEILALAAHYAKLPSAPSREPVDRALAARGAELAEAMRCGSCHLPDYRGREQMPRLAHQRIDYVIDALIAYREGKRYGVDTTMNGMMYQVSDQDIRALANFLATVP